MKLSLAIIALILRSVSCSFDVTCRYNTNDHWVVSYSEKYFCVINDIEVEVPDKVIESISGVHQSGKSNNNVNTLRINQSPECNYFPKGLGKFFNNLKGIMVTFTGLQAITRNDLKPFPDILDFWIYSSKLKTIGPNLFIFNNKLKFVDFGDNHIYSIAADLFDPLKDLSEVKFNQNNCIDKDGSGASGIAAVKKHILERCQNGSPSTSDCQSDHEKIALLQNNNALLQKEVDQLKSEIDKLTTF